MYTLHNSYNFKNISWLGKLINVAVLVSAPIGCSTNLPQTPGYYAIDIDSHVPKINRVALVTDLTPPEIESVNFGVTQGKALSEGVAEGAFKGAGYSLIAGPAYFLVLPFFVTAGVVGGAASGAASGYTADMLAEAEAKAQYILDSAYVQNILLSRVQDYGNANVDLEFIRMPSADQKTLLNKPDYTALTDESIDAVFEVELLRIALKSPNSKLSQLKIDVRIRLISAHMGTVLSDNQYQYSSLFFDLEQWIADEAALLTNELKRGLQRLAEDAIDENFLLFYPNIPDDIPMSFWGMSGTPYVLNPVFPEFEWLSYVGIDTLQPTLKWERFPRDYDLIDADGKLHDITDVRYELRILSPGGIKQVYYVSDIPEPYHKIENSLKACSRYIWTVRARFKLDGRTRITEWAAAFNVPGWDEKPWNLRRGKYGFMIKHGAEWFYYRFKTPCGSEKAPEPESPMQDDEF